MCAETLGSWSFRGLNLIRMIDNKLKEATDEPRSTFFLFKQIAIKKETLTLSVFSEMDYFQAKKGIPILKLYTLTIHYIRISSCNYSLTNTKEVYIS